MGKDGGRGAIAAPHPPLHALRLTSGPVPARGFSRARRRFGRALDGASPAAVGAALRALTLRRWRPP
jgi:hypothetical protein